MNEFLTAAATILSAKTHAELFGAEVEDKYKELARLVHPDKHLGTDRESTATKAMTKLNELHDIATGKKTPPPSWAPVTIKVKRDTYIVGAPFAHGDLADVHDCIKEGSDEKLVVKVVRNASDNDLMKAEVDCLKKLRGSAFDRFSVEVKDSFVLGKPGRQCTVMNKIEDNISLAAILEKKPKGLDFRDVTWMLKRALSSIGYAHREGYIYGGFSFDNVLIHPVNHGMKLLDWCFSVKEGQPLKAYSVKAKAFYPPEVFRKDGVTDAVDVYMVAAVFDSLLDLDAPKKFKNLLKGCLLSNPRVRPSAWGLYDELNTLMLELVGASKYRELVL